MSDKGVYRIAPKAYSAYERGTSCHRRCYANLSIQQLKRDSPLIQLSDPDISIKNCMSKNFDLAAIGSRLASAKWMLLLAS